MADHVTRGKGNSKSHMHLEINQLLTRLLSFLTLDAPRSVLQKNTHFLPNSMLEGSFHADFKPILN